jgi:hypothetical protein
MIRQAAPKRVEVVVPFPQRIEKSVEVPNINVRRRAQFLNPVLKPGCADAQGFVRTECRKHPRLQIGFCNGPVKLKIVRRVIGSAHDLYPKPFQNFMCAQFGEHCVSSLPDSRRAALIQQLMNLEITLQFEMRPLV